MSVEEAWGNTATEDIGLYQFYGRHPCYLPRQANEGDEEVLLYVGKTVDQTFGQRLKQHGWMSDLWHRPLNCHVRLGRLQPGARIQISERIANAEKLTIWWHSPPYNAWNIAKAPQIPDGTAVENKGAHGQLLVRYPLAESEWSALFE